MTNHMTDQLSVITIVAILCGLCLLPYGMVWTLSIFSLGIATVLCHVIADRRERRQLVRREK